MTAIDEELLDEKLAELEKMRTWSPRTMAKLDALLHTPDDEALVRVNPLAVARERGIPQAEAIDLFLHAVHLGIFTMGWHLLCPLCGSAVQSFASLRVLHRHIWCGLCRINADANLDDYIQVTFTVAPNVRRLPFHDPASLSAEDFVYKLTMTREMHLGSVDGPRMRDVLASIMKVLIWVPAESRRDFAFDVEPGAMSIAELHAHASCGVQVTADAPPTRLDLVIGEGTLTTSTEVVRAGRVEGSITNPRPIAVVFALDHHSAEAIASGQMPRTALEPIVTGAMLLTNQTFRRLFRSETVPGTEGIGVREVTILFTDLKGSTALYERIGDFQAFSLVQRHFDQLGAVIASNNGAIVKTIGDAVMAAFTRPADAVRAAFEMLDRIARSNREHASNDIVLKVGIHRGPSIAVTLNNALDYFGHTVNVAARVQGLADAGEIYVTDEVFRADDVAALLGAVEPRDAQLRGIQREVRVYRAVRA